METSNPIQQWAKAIAEYEGFYYRGSRPQRNHNPGNLKFAEQDGAIGKDIKGFAIFVNDALGMLALERQLKKYVADFPDYTIEQAMAHYLGQPKPMADEQGDSRVYASFIARRMQVSATSTLKEIFQSQEGKV